MKGTAEKIIMKRIIPLLLMPLFAAGGFAQMPEWAMIMDKEGNAYYFDASGKIYIVDGAVPEYIPISKDTVVYYTEKVKELWKAGHRKQAVAIAKSVLALRESSSHVINAKKNMAEFVHRKKAQHGNRFVDINRSAWLYLTKEGSVMYLFNDKVPYIVSVSGSAEVISAKSVDSLQHSATVLRTGIRFAGSGGYDAVMTIAAERFAGAIESVSIVEQHWRNIGFDTFKRTLIMGNETRRIYSFITDDALQLHGVELMAVKENRGYLVRIFTSRERFTVYKDEMFAIINGFSTP